LPPEVQYPKREALVNRNTTWLSTALWFTLIPAAAAGMQIERTPSSPRVRDQVPGGGLPTISLSATHQPTPSLHLELFAVGPDGAVRGLFKEQNSVWRPPFAVSAPGLAPAGAPVASVFIPHNEQVEVFVVAADGGIRSFWKARNSAWSAPVSITPRSFAPPGAALAAVFNPQNDQVEVFVVGNDGTVKVVWKTRNEPWQGPSDLTDRNTAPPGSPIAAALYPLNNHLEVFVVGADGGVKGVWKAQNAAWRPMFAVTPARVAPAGAPLAAAYHAPNHQLEVFFVGRDGAMRVAWKAQNGAWQSPVAISPADFALAGSPVAVVSQPLHNQLEVFVVDRQGALRLLWKAGTGTWQTPVRLSPPNAARPGVPVAAALHQPNNHLEAFFADREGSIRGVWKANNGSWQPVFHVARAGITPIYTFPQCLSALQRWRAGSTDELRLESCRWIVGIEQFCRDQDALVVVAYDDRGRNSHFACSPRHRRLSVTEQADLLVHGIGEGIADGFVAAAPYLGVAISGVACVKGVLFACATLAVDMVSRAGVLPPEAADGMKLAEKMLKCADGDVAACADAAAKAVKGSAGQLGVKLPDVEPGKNHHDAEKCADGDFAACARLGAAAAKVAGVPPGMSPPGSNDVANAADCLNNKPDACRALGHEAAHLPGFPLKGIVQGDALAAACRRGDASACAQLGRALALAAR
jgi:hypothetical protein